MRTSISSTVVAALLVLAVIAPASAQGKPEKLPYAPETLSWDAGDFCPFDVMLEDHFAKGMMTFHENRWILAGNYKGTIWNNDMPELALDYNLGGNVKFRFRADGSLATTSASGTFMAWYPTDEDETSPFGKKGIFLHTGRLIERYNSAGEFEGATLVGQTLVDYCAALAPAS